MSLARIVEAELTHLVVQGQVMVNPRLTDIVTCPCQGCRGLRARYKVDPKLLHFYTEKLLQRGWAGSTDEVEQDYMGNHASWYKAAQERGRQTAARTGFGMRFAQAGEASAPVDGEFATHNGETHPTTPVEALEATRRPAQLPLALV